jgi:hypothetical protein
MIDMIPVILPHCVPMFAVMHVFAVLGIVLFRGRLNSETDFGDGAGADPYYGLLSFSGYLNSMIIMLNLLVVNNWVKMGAGVSNAMGTLWTYVYFCAYFVIGVVFALHNLVAMFIQCVAESSPKMSIQAFEANVHNKFIGEREEQTRSYQSESYAIKLRKPDFGQLYSAIHQTKVSDYFIMRLF